MRRSKLTLLLGGLLVTTALAAACGSTTPAATTTTTTATTTTTETYSGTLSLNGSASYNFTASAAGTVTATMTTLTGGPASLNIVGIGFAIGTWNGTSCSTTFGIGTSAAIQGTVLSGQISSAGSLCVAVSDASAILTTPVSYTLTVVHP